MIRNLLFLALVATSPLAGQTIGKVTLVDGKVLDELVMDEVSPKGVKVEHRNRPLTLRFAQLTPEAAKAMGALDIGNPGPYSDFMKGRNRISNVLRPVEPVAGETEAARKKRLKQRVILTQSECRRVWGLVAKEKKLALDRQKEGIDPPKGPSLVAAWTAVAFAIEMARVEAEAAEKSD